jgi:hypothetical protein
MHVSAELQEHHLDLSKIGHRKGELNAAVRGFPDFLGGVPSCSRTQRARRGNALKRKVTGMEAAPLKMPKAPSS